MHRSFFLALACAVIAFSPARAADTDAPEGFTPLFNGKDLTGWKVHGGKLKAWGAADGLLFTSGSGGGWLMTEKEYADFELRLEYKLPTNGNSGVTLRSPMKGDPAYTGMEIQILDNPKYKNLKPAQYTGSIYDVVPPVKDATKPVGEWNQFRIVAKGSRITIELNGVEIVNANLEEHKDKAKRHPGILRDKGH
ncbi:hypothetical protein BHU16_10365, partial [Tannerella sp. oral taxon 808]